MGLKGDSVGRGDVEVHRWDVLSIHVEDVVVRVGGKVDLKGNGRQLDLPATVTAKFADCPRLLFRENCVEKIS